MKFIVYADIHHDEYAAKCLTLKDTLAIEKSLFARAKSGGFDFVLFAGDRFLKREPKDEVKVKADSLLFRCLHECNPGFYYFHLLGNHDRVDNTLKWHTSESLKALVSGEIAAIMDVPCTVFHPIAPVAIHALPAGFTFDAEKYDFSKPEYLNIFCFHDIVRGSTSDSDGSHIFDKGINLEEIDLPQFDLVYAGDIHVPQKLNLSHGRGGYVGSVLQRTRADAMKARGWLEVEAERQGEKWVTRTTFVPTRNFFTRVELQVNDDTTYHDLNCQIEETWIPDQTVEVRLCGTKANVDRLAEEPKWRNYVDILGARTIEITRAYNVEKSSAIVDMSGAKSPIEDLTRYLDSGFAEVGTLSREKLEEIIGGIHG